MAAGRPPKRGATIDRPQRRRLDQHQLARELVQGETFISLAPDNLNVRTVPICRINGEQQILLYFLYFSADSPLTDIGPTRSCGALRR